MKRRKNTNEKVKLVGYVDADFAGCKRTRKSTGGWLFLINGTPVSWSSKRQSTIASSTTEAEYMQAHMAAQEAVWIRQLLADLGHTQVDATILYEDNEPAIKLSIDPALHQKSKHFDVKYHVLRERVARKQVTLQYIRTEDQIADIFTKALPGPVFRKHLSKFNF